MKKKFILLKAIMLIASASLITGCFDNKDESKKNTSTNHDTGKSYDGFWYYSPIDFYLEISNNKAKLRLCSVNDGYRVKYTGDVIGDKLVINNTTTTLKLANNILSTTGDNNENSIDFSKQAEIPAACINDAIEITSILPSSATEGVSTAFIVEFIYRLSSTNSGIVHLGFNTEVVDSSILVTDQLIITNKETSSGRLTANVMPVFYYLPNSFEADINLSNFPHATNWTPLVSDTTLITVSKSALVNTGESLVNNSDQLTTQSSCTGTLVRSCESNE